MPTILRAVLRVNFDPVTETPKGSKSSPVSNNCRGKHVDLGQYDVIDVYLYQGVPEQEIREREFERKLKSPSPRP